MRTKKYLGDGVYVDHDRRGLVLTTENGYGATNTVILEPEVFANLLHYLGIESVTTSTAWVTLDAPRRD
jgi:hypothetical protein